MKIIWKTGRVETIISYMAAGAVLVGALVFLGKEATHHINAFKLWIESLGPWALVAFMLLYAILSSIFVPDTLLGIVAGVTFGFIQGIATVICGSILATMLQYVLSRWLLRPTIDKVLASKPTLATIQSAVLKKELKLQFLIRLRPLNRVLTSYVLGAAGVRFSLFLFACVAMLPNLCLEVYFGVAGKHLVRTAGQPEHEILTHDAVMVTGLVVAIVVMIIVSKTARQSVDLATEALPVNLSQ